MTKKKVTKKEIREISLFDCSFAISKCCKGHYGENDVTVALNAIGRSFAQSDDYSCVRTLD